jgi:hypothetical protein
VVNIARREIVKASVLSQADVWPPAFVRVLLCNDAHYRNNHGGATAR